MESFEPTWKEKVFGRLCGHRPAGKLSKKTRTLLRRIQNETIEHIVVIRTPIDKYVRALMFAVGIPARHIEQDMQVDNLFHTALLINGRILYEKQHIIKLRECTEEYLDHLDSVTQAFDVGYMLQTPDPITFLDLVLTHRRIMTAEEYTGYRSMDNNCQHFVASALEAIATLTQVPFNADDPTQLLQLFQLIQPTANIDPNLYKRAERILDPCVSCWRWREIVTNGVR